MKMKISFVLVNLIIAFSLLCSFVSAFGVRPSFGPIIELVPGETKEVSFTLMNNAGSDTVSLAPILSKDPVISAEIINPVPFYTLEVGQDQKVYIRLSAPPDAVIGEQHVLAFVLNTVTPNEKGTFGFGSSIEQQIVVNVVLGVPPKVEEPVAPPVEVKEEKPINSGILIAAIILMIGIIITLLTRKKNAKNIKKSKKRKK